MYMYLIVFEVTGVVLTRLKIPDVIQWFLGEGRRGWGYQVETPYRRRHEFLPWRIGRNPRVVHMYPLVVNWFCYFSPLCGTTAKDYCYNGFHWIMY